MARVIYASYNPFTPEVWVGAHYYSSLFAKHGHRVIYLSTPISPGHFLDLRKKMRPERNASKKAFFGGPKPEPIEGQQNLLTYAPHTLLPTIKFLFPFNTSLVGKNTLKLTWPKLERVLEQNGFASPDIFWIENVRYLPVAENMRPDTLVQRVHDNMAAFPSEKFMMEMYTESLRRSQVVFCMSKSLIEDYIGEMAGNRKKVHYLPNGVSDMWFNVPKQLPEPQDLKNIPKPRVIMVGVFEFWVDYEKLWKLARIMPGVSFVMVGPVKVKLPGHMPENVHFIGRKPHHQVPGYLLHSQLGLSIFKQTKLTEYVNLIKLYEYLAMGLPTVSTAHRELRLIDAPWLLANTVEEFKRAVETGLEMGESEKQSFISFARENTWEKRFEMVREVLGL